MYMEIKLMCILLRIDSKLNCFENINDIHYRSAGSVTASLEPHQRLCSMFLASKMQKRFKIEIC